MSDTTKKTAKSKAAAEGADAPDPLTEAVKRNVALVVQHVSTSPIIAERIRKDRLLVVGGVYDLETGLVELTANVPEAFKPAEAGAGKPAAKKA